jgi:hypothetical protein
MKRPFPGMDPYLELHWRDVHHRLVTYATDQLQSKLPSDLIARMEEQVYVEPHNLEVRGRIIYPNVRVTEHSALTSDEGGVAVAEAIAEPLVIYLPERTTEGYIEIREARANQRLITVIEVLSPSNKSEGKGRQLYRQKQDELLEAGVNLVELDLLRGGEWVMSVPEGEVPAPYRASYCACVRRDCEPHKAEIYRFPLREPLPSIKIPLRKTDRDVAINLQSLIDQCYINGRYDSIDYSVELEPPFVEADEAWVRELLKSAGRR